MTGRPANECGEVSTQSGCAGPKTVASTASLLHNHDSKFNVVLYGVEECRAGLSTPARFDLISLMLSIYFLPLIVLSNLSQSKTATG